MSVTNLDVGRPARPHWMLVIIQFVHDGLLKQLLRIYVPQLVPRVSFLKDLGTLKGSIFAVRAIADQEDTLSPM